MVDIILDDGSSAQWVSTGRLPPSFLTYLVVHYGSKELAICKNTVHGNMHPMAARAEARQSRGFAHVWF